MSVFLWIFRKCFVSLLSLPIVSILTLGIAVAAPSTTQLQAPPVKSLTAEQAALDVRVLRRALLALHPALTKYQTDAEWQAALAKFDARGNAARNSTEMFLAASELAASIKCGHTWANVGNQSGAIRSAIFDAANKLPLQMTWVEERWLVLSSATSDVERGDEITHVNGIAASAMVAQLWPYLRADGASDSKRFRQLGHDRIDMSQLDITWPLLSPPQEGRYSLRVKRGTRTFEVSVGAVTLAAREQTLLTQGVRPIDESWSFSIQRNAESRSSIGVLRLPNFAMWSSNFDWQSFLDKSFTELHDKKVTKLIIDIRDNEGGDGAIGAKIVSYLLKAPFRYESDQSITVYERAPYILMRYLDTWDYGFFDRTGKVRRVTKGPQAGKLEVIERAVGPRVIEPAARRYEGKVVILVGGENSSATFQFAWLAQQAKVATLIGQPTGGNLRGLTGGELTWVTLPNTGVSVDVPLLATRYEFDTPDRSVIPDLIVKRSFSAQRAGTDEELQAAIKFLSN